MKTLSEGKKTEYTAKDDELLSSFVLTKKDKTDTGIDVYKSGGQYFFSLDETFFELSADAFNVLNTDIEKIQQGE